LGFTLKTDCLSFDLLPPDIQTNLKSTQDAHLQIRYLTDLFNVVYMASPDANITLNLAYQLAARYKQIGLYDQAFLLFEVAKGPIQNQQPLAFFELALMAQDGQISDELYAKYFSGIQDYQLLPYKLLLAEQLYGRAANLGHLASVKHKGRVTDEITAHSTRPKAVLLTPARSPTADKAAPDATGRCVPFDPAGALTSDDFFPEETELDLNELLNFDPSQLVSGGLFSSSEASYKLPCPLPPTPPSDDDSLPTGGFN
jgi:TPR repeat protein